MKKREGNEIIRELESLKVLPKRAELRLTDEIEKRLNNSIQKSKKKINKNKNELIKNQDYTNLFKIYASELNLCST